MGFSKQLKKALIERALGAELTEHLGYEKGDPAGRGSGNSRNGASAKTILTEDGEIEIAVEVYRTHDCRPLRYGYGLPGNEYLRLGSRRYRKGAD
jgi:putative transposase